jgi:hypothetical protein
MFGEGISLDDLLTLLRAIREKKLQLRIRILDEPWEELSPRAITRLVAAILAGKVRSPDTVKLELR